MTPAPADPARRLRLLLDPPTLERARAGRHGFLARLVAAVEGAGMRVELGPNDASSRASVEEPDLALYHMEGPVHPRALTFRMTGIAPFWRIERSPRRWEWEVALADHDPARIDPGKAARFLARLQRHRFGGAALGARREGFVYVPLQGRLLQHRSFQSMSPLEMLEQTLSRTGDRPILATLHPREGYDPAERRALDALAARHSRLRLSEAPMEKLLAGCDMVVTQNSTVALAGHVFEKPAVLFARTDFHHLAGSVPRDGLDAAFARAEGPPPDFARYLRWYCRDHALDPRDAAAEAAILARFRRLGWEI